MVETSGARVSMDGKGRAFDNIMIERLWRSVKYEDIYPKGYECLSEVKKGLKMYFQFYNENRPHQGLQYRTPMEMYYERKWHGSDPSRADPPTGGLGYSRRRGLSLFWSYIMNREVLA